MFVDYYQILEIPVDATADQIKGAFKRQALKWHPDKNPGRDTTKQMQLINEAKLILLDIEARARYDKEYSRFKQFQSSKSQSESFNKKTAAKEPDLDYSDYAVDDEILNRWMNNAKKQAVDLAKQTIEDLKGMVV